MDADPATVVGVLKEMKASRKAVVGMKILGQGVLRNRQDEGSKFAVSNGVVDAFTIGAESKQGLQELIRRIATALRNTQGRMRSSDPGCVDETNEPEQSRTNASGAT
jgi:hypothetical protein